jgi:adenylate cyclase
VTEAAEEPERDLSEPGERGPLTAQWREMLLGTDPGLAKVRSWWMRVPTAPRCKLCAAPFRGIGAQVTRLTGHGPSMVNPLLCNICFGKIRKEPGGAEIEISVLFADIRGSTAIAERTTAAAFSRLVQTFYFGAAKAIDAAGGIVDKFLGDGIMALFIPVVTGERHAARAIEAGRAVLEASETASLRAGGVRVGVGVHTGEAFVGTVGAGDRLDFSALGDTVNVAARLGSLAGPGYLVVSAAAWAAAGVDDPRATRQTLELKGREAALDVVVISRLAGAEPAG